MPLYHSGTDCEQQKQDEEKCPINLKHSRLSLSVYSVSSAHRSNIDVFSRTCHRHFSPPTSSFLFEDVNFKPLTDRKRAF